MKNLLVPFQALSRHDAVISDWAGGLVSLALRLYVGWQFFKAGMVKLSDWNATLTLFQYEYHVPLLSPHLAAWLGAGGELVFPVLLFIGLLGRPAALGLLFVNITAVLSYPELFKAECPAGINDHFYWGILLLVLAAFGSGRFSLDALLKRYGFSR
ncbi:DoxX family membrane protein [Pseudoduganella sp. FT25W]|uniref:DoxX family membrane protein n=1 Tax=Duganella alba TaxID=2666081 RepID=A0A6L5QA42_9BURK|nr:DoxX family protein [Duganella alba]MRX06674.1 DoxX family membrane protein [Duganella alba]MRX17974.1 DoxX family membrane protein [Duganella alba]